MAAVATATVSVFLALVVVLASQLRNDPRASRAFDSKKPRVVVIRRVYETVIRERVIAAPGTTGTPGPTVSTSAASVSSSLPSRAPRTRTS